MTIVVSAAAATEVATIDDTALIVGNEDKGRMVAAGLRERDDRGDGEVVDDKVKAGNDMSFEIDRLIVFPGSKGSRLGAVSFGMRPSTADMYSH